MVLVWCGRKFPFVRKKTQVETPGHFRRFWCDVDESFHSYEKKFVLKLRTTFDEFGAVWPVFAASSSESVNVFHHIFERRPLDPRTERLVVAAQTICDREARILIAPAVFEFPRIDLLEHVPQKSRAIPREMIVWNVLHSDEFKYAFR